MKLHKTIIALFLVFSCTTIFANTPTDSIGKTTIDGKEFIIYMVSGGETIYGISTKYHVPIDQLMEHNPALVNGLKTAMILNIPYFPNEIKADGLVDLENEKIDVNIIDRLTIKNKLPAHIAFLERPVTLTDWLFL